MNTFSIGAIINVPDKCFIHHNFEILRVDILGIYLNCIG
jgi:hypothetical protein